MGSKRKNIDQLTKDLEDVIRKLYTQIQGTNEEKRETITKEVEAKINSVESAQKARKASRFKARATEIPDDIDTLMEEFGYTSIFSVFKNMKRNGIYTKRKILQAIQEKAELGITEEEANVQIAQEGNVTLDAVARIRQENREPQRKLGDKTVRFKARAAEIPDDTEILMKEFGYTGIDSVYRNMKANGIYTKRKILQAIQEKAKLGISEEEANEQIAQEGNVTLDAVARIRQGNLKSQSKLEDKVARFKARAAEIPDDTETLMKEFNYKNRKVVTFYMVNYGIYGKRRILQAIQEKAELGISEEEANKQIAEEGNVTIQAVARIRDQKKEKQENRKKEGKERQSKVGEKAARFKARAAEIPDDTETLMKEFNYKNRKVVTFYMVNYGIYGKRRILQAIQEKAELGISEEEANKQIAEEGNVTIQAVARIRDQKKEKQENRKKEGKERQSKVGEKAARFKARAAEIPDDTEILMKEFGYTGIDSVYKNMKANGIYTKRKILQAIREKAELGITEEEANKQIAQEGNVTLDAVARIRQGISRPKTRSTRDNVQPSSTQTKTSDKSKVQTDVRTVPVQSRVIEPKTEQPVKTTKDARIPITHTTDTKPEVKPHVAKPRQITKQVQKSEIEEARQREIEQKRLEEELQQVAEKNAQKEQAIKQETEAFLEMAKMFLPSSSIRGKFQHIDDYDMILIRRKHKILSREEVEELIETTTLSDEEIARKANGEVTGVEEVRESIRRRQELNASVSDAKRNFTIGLLKESRIY